MNEINKNLFSAAIVENNIIKNVLVFDNEKTMQDFGAVPLAEGQGIGDIYQTPKEYAEKKLVERVVSNAKNAINQT